MKDAFYEFEWDVAPVYEWQAWLDANGSAVGPPSKLLNRLEWEVNESGRRLGKDLSAKRSAATAAVYFRLERQRSELALRTGPILTRIDPDQSRSYRPMDRQHSALFRAFAELDHRNAGAILKFASQHGELGLVHGHQTVTLRDQSGHPSGSRTAHGESHLAWAIEICHMREALRLSRLTSFDALRRLKQLSDRHLPHVRAGLAFDKTRKPQLSVQPLTLISALWLQFALAITGDKEFVGCKFCKRLLEISTEQTGFRRHREFCSDACKTKDYRKRKRTALRQAKAGDNLGDIAKKTSTDVATVRAWLARAKTSRSHKSGER